MPKIPGTAWIALISFISTWLGLYFNSYWWVAGTITILGAVVKLIEMGIQSKQDSQPTARGEYPKEKRSELSTLLFG